jgi:hypothetical protein
MSKIYKIIITIIVILSILILIFGNTVYLYFSTYPNGVPLEDQKTITSSQKSSSQSSTLSSSISTSSAKMVDVQIFKPKVGVAPRELPKNVATTNTVIVKPTPKTTIEDDEFLNSKIKEEGENTTIDKSGQDKIDQALKEFDSKIIQK